VFSHTNEGLDEAAAGRRGLAYCGPVRVDPGGRIIHARPGYPTQRSQRNKWIVDVGWTNIWDPSARACPVHGQDAMIGFARSALRFFLPNPGEVEDADV